MNEAINDLDSDDDDEDEKEKNFPEKPQDPKQTIDEGIAPLESLLSKLMMQDGNNDDTGGQEDEVMQKVLQDMQASMMMNGNDDEMDEQAMANLMQEITQRQAEWMNQDTDDSFLQGFVGNDGDLDALLDDMMEQLLSKDLMYEPIQKVAERFPAWLKQHEGKIEEIEWKRYVKTRG